MYKKRASINVLAISVMLSGCALLPAPASTIGAPQSVSAAKAAGTESTASFIQKFLPPGARLLPPEEPQGSEAVQLQDINGDHEAEIFVTYRNGTEDKTPYVMMLEKENNEWKKAMEHKGQGYQVSTVRFADITGDGKPEFLVGWTIGASAGNGLDVFAWRNETLQKIASTAYHKLEILPNGKQNMLAFWQKDTGDAYMVDVVRWNGSAFVSAKDAYPSYFKKVAAYYEEKIKEMPDAAFYWYYLADAQQKANMSEQAIQSAKKGLFLLQSDYPKQSQFETIIADSLDDLGKKNEAQKIREKVRQLEAKGK
ncbi:FG-GAP repeat domain-containing protein [Aneurinibacillus danicus]|jgi:bla regulator protein BlaR1|uniref:Lipoprotein n=1 Tax=Aneurinibacillus danicus TaxID=267746 RepID=A0A511VBQ7_9BACL|nr:VCBS repeat-containing protein [Aneurinibacillus danicus]GEN36259.1 hypothetical protein ADA01nite_37190 [Aneurinibacillus danicus]